MVKPNATANVEDAEGAAFKATSGEARSAPGRHLASGGERDPPRSSSGAGGVIRFKIVPRRC